MFARFDATGAHVAARFDAIDVRFEAIDARFDRIDRRFDAVDARLDGLDIRVQAVEARALDTKPIWERALAEILRGARGKHRAEV